MQHTAAPPLDRPQRDLTTGRLGLQLLQQSLPATAEVALFGGLGLIHAYWLGRLGGGALAAETMATTLRIALISPMMGLSMGGMAVVARHVGAQDARGADRALMQTILLMAAFVLPLAAIGLVFGPTFLTWMGSTGVLHRDAVAYLRVICFGLLFMEMLPTLNGVIRGAGHPEYTFRINLVNVAVLAILDPLLILGYGPVPAMGITGAALASVAANAVGVAAQLYVLWRGSAGLRLHAADLRPDTDLMRRVLRIALPTSAQRFAPNLANALLLRLVASFGPVVLTAYSVVHRVFGFAQCPAMGVGSAAATLVGQNLGARRLDRATRSGWLSAATATAAMLVLLGALNLVPRPVLGLFERGDAILEHAVAIARYMLVIGAAFGWATVMANALGGAGDAVVPMAINIGVLWLLQLPLCWLLSWGAGLGPEGIWLGLAGSNLVLAVLMGIRFHQGRWRRIVL